MAGNGEFLRFRPVIREILYLFTEHTGATGYFRLCFRRRCVDGFLTRLDESRGGLLPVDLFALEGINELGICFCGIFFFLSTLGLCGLFLLFPLRLPDGTMGILRKLLVVKGLLLTRQKEVSGDVDKGVNSCASHRK